MKKAAKWNFILFGIVCFAVVWMASGLHFSEGEVVLSSPGWSMLKYYTVDSNLLMGAVALIVALAERKERELPVWCGVLKLIGTSAVLLTFLVTVFFLVPTFPNPITLFYYSNFFLHLLIPLLSLFIFLRFERSNRLTVSHALWGLSSLALYAMYYIPNVLLHLQNGQIDRAYDWYGFFMLGVSSVFVVVPVIFAVMLGISAALWRLNRTKK